MFMLMFIFIFIFPITYSLLPIPYSLFSIPYFSYFSQITNMTPQTIKLKPTRRIKGIDSLKIK